ncbi:MAG: SEC-C metal-binding domain-containing protein [Hyphomicrobium sp.]
MIFAIEPETRRLIADVPHDGGREVFDCSADACGNPACACRTTTVTLRPRSPSAAPQRKVGIDLVTNAIDGPFRKRGSPEDLAFAEGLLAAMDAADFALLDTLHANLKHRICEDAKPSEVVAHFDYDEIESSSMLLPYNDALPFSDTFRVAVGDSEFLVIDQFCVRSGCRCTDALLSLFQVGGEGKAADGAGAVRVDHATGAWEAVEGEPFPCPVADFRHLMEGANPNLYKLLRARHTRLRAIYAHCRQRDLQTIASASRPTLAARPESVGRNDPCPCGSGKKYKKCCLGKSANLPEVGANGPAASEMVAPNRVPRLS